MRVGWVYDRFLERHETGAAHPERPERPTWIADALADAGLIRHMRPIACEPLGQDVIGWVHEPAYVDMVRIICEEGFTFVGDRETKICRASFEVARRAAGGVVAACEAVMTGTITRAFCAVRPPGHHADRGLAGGYCLFNNIAIAAESLIRRHALKRVAIVDWDVHHGNGTQHLFEDRDDVLFVSLHESPGYQYPGTGFETEVGHGRGMGFTLNLPMSPGSDDKAYRKAFADRVIPRLRQFAPQFVLVSAGFDAAREDRTADINLEPGSYRWMTRDLVAVAEEFCAGRLVSVLEGGYEPASLGRCAVQHVEALIQSA